MFFFFEIGEIKNQVNCDCNTYGKWYERKGKRFKIGDWNLYNIHVMRLILIDNEFFLGYISKSKEQRSKPPSAWSNLLNLFLILHRIWPSANQIQFFLYAYTICILYITEFLFIGIKGLYPIGPYSGPKMLFNCWLN